MTALLDQVPTEEIMQARKSHPVRPGRILLTLVLGVFFVLGWLAGRTLLLLGDCWNSARIGYWKGKGMTAEDIARRLTPEPAAG